MNSMYIVYHCRSDSHDSIDLSLTHTHTSLLLRLHWRLQFQTLSPVFGLHVDGLRTGAPPLWLQLLWLHRRRLRIFRTRNPPRARHDGPVLCHVALRVDDPFECHVLVRDGRRDGGPPAAQARLGRHGQCQYGRTDAVARYLWIGGPVVVVVARRSRL